MGGVNLVSSCSQTVECVYTCVHHLPSHPYNPTALHPHTFTLSHPTPTHPHNPAPSHSHIPHPHTLTPSQLEQAEEQERLLEASARELEERRRKELRLRRQLQEKEAEQVDMEERYASLQEEAAGKTRRLREVWKQFQAAKEEVRGVEVERGGQRMCCVV